MNVRRLLLRARVDRRGSVSAMVVLFPLFAIVTFMIVQTVAWQHERQSAAAVADRTSLAVALYGSSPGQAQADAVADLQAAGLRDVSVSVDRSADATVVTITGRVPGILVGTSIQITARSVTPTQGYASP